MTVETFRAKLKKHIDKINDGILRENFLKDLIYTYSQAKPQDYNRMLEELYGKKQYHQNLHGDIMNARVEEGIRPRQSMDRVMYVINKRLAPVLYESRVCYPRIIRKTRVPFGLNKTNFSSYAFMFYYTSLIDSLSYDHEGTLLFVKFVAQCVCETNMDKFADVQMDVLKSLNFNVLCR